MVAFGVHESGRREVIGIEIAESETEAGWAAFLRELRARGLQGVRLCVSDDHLGLKAAVAKVLGCAWQRCTVHFIRNMHGHCKVGQRNMVSAALREVFNAGDLRDAGERLAAVVERLAPTAPKVAALLEEAEVDLLAFYRFPAAHWPKLRSTNNLERVNKEIARRSDVVGIFPSDRSVIRLVGALLIEQNDEGWGAPHPTFIYNGGGNASGSIDDVHWSSWGGAVAHGPGRHLIFKPRGGYYRC
jgi:putative transposase